MCRYVFSPVARVVVVEELVVAAVDDQLGHDELVPVSAQYSTIAIQYSTVKHL